VKLSKWVNLSKGVAMKAHRRFGTLLAAMVIACALPLASSQGMGGGMGGARMYNPATETTVNGTVEKVATISGRSGWSGTHLDLKTDSGIVDVHLGPSAYLSSKGFQFANNDQLEVTGSKVMYQGHPAIIAREVKMGGKVLTLRNAQGIPEWSRGQRGSGPGTGNGTGGSPQ
jgi:hypothetical protein